MGMTDELRDIKALLSEINQNQENDSDLEYASALEITKKQNEKVNIFQKIDEYETLTIDIPTETFIELALEAHKRDMKLNDLIVEILTDYAKKVLEDK